jgi:hypothetical protein
MLKVFHVFVIFLFTNVNAISQSDNLSKGLVAHFPFNGNANDASGNNNNGKVTGARLSPDMEGKANSAYYFDGKSYITVPNHPSLNFGNAMSSFAWIKLDNAENDQKILSKAFPFQYQGGYLLGVDKSQVYPEVFDNFNQRVGGKKGPAISSNSWHFVGFTFSSSKLKYFADGKLIFETQISSGSISNNQADLMIGTNSWEKPPKNLSVKGIIDEIRIYNRELSENEVKSLYGLYAGETLKTPVISWEIPASDINNHTSEYFTLRACIKSKLPLTSIQVFLNNQLYQEIQAVNTKTDIGKTCDALFEERITLTRGENQVRIVVGNKSGLATSETRTIYYNQQQVDITPPIITLIEPKIERGFKIAQDKDIIRIVGKVEDQNGIYYVSVNGVRTVPDKDNIFTANLPIGPGESMVTINAIDNRQNLSEFSFYVNRISNIKVVSENIVSGEKRIALIIGNGAYPTAPLRNPANDARLMTDELAKLGFETTSIIDGNQTQIKKAISDFGDLLGADKNTIGLFYYAGHGLQVKGKNYIIPVDAKIEKEADVVVYCVDLDGLLANLEYAANNLNVIILDACRNNPYSRSFRSSAGNGLATVTAPSGTIIAFATAPGSTAADGEGSNGLYTQEFVKALQFPNIRIEDIFKKTRTQVKAISGGKQIPWENSALEGDFYFKKF